MKFPGVTVIGLKICNVMKKEMDVNIPRKNVENVISQQSHFSHYIQQRHSLTNVQETHITSICIILFVYYNK